MGSRTVALVPLRSPGAGKTRLAPALTPDQRAALAGAMLADVTRTLVAADIDEVVVAAGGAAAAAAGAALGASVVLDPHGTRSLDGALQAAAARIGPADQLLVVAADLPRLTADEVLAVLAADTSVVIAPTAGGGTGGLLRRPPAVVATAYGRASAARHRRLARQAGVTWAMIDTPGFRHDVDTWTDLVALHDVVLGPTTASLLPTLLGPLSGTGGSSGTAHSSA